MAKKNLEKFKRRWKKEQEQRADILQKIYGKTYEEVLVRVNVQEIILPLDTEGDNLDPDIPRLTKGAI